MRSGFQPGQPKPPNSGRKKGTGNKLKKVRDLLAEHNLHPAREVIDILLNGDLKDEKRAALWMQLQEYCEAKPKENEKDTSAEDEVSDLLKDISTDELLKIRLVKPNEVP